MPPPKAITSKHLMYAAVPSSRIGDLSSVATFYVARVAELDSSQELIDARRDRIQREVQVPEPAGLQQLVHAARRRLKDVRVREDGDEIATRRYVVEQVKGRLGQ